MFKNNLPFICLSFFFTSHTLADTSQEQILPLIPLVFDCNKPGMVAITFDDGPSENFPVVLEILERHEVKATFFLLGEKLEYYPNVDLALQAQESGHQIENHSWDHPDFKTLSNNQIHTQVNQTNQVIQEALDLTPRFFRPPYGRLDVFKAMPVWDLNMGIALWNLDSQDYRSSLTWGPTQVFQRIENTLEKSSPSKDSFIILMHDSSSSSVRKLEDIIISVKDHGYSLVTLNECVDSGR